MNENAPAWAYERAEIRPYDPQWAVDMHERTRDFIVPAIIGRTAHRNQRACLPGRVFTLKG